MTAPPPDAVPGRLTGRVAVITGASRGIGLAVATRLVAEGARVTITGRKPEPLAEAVATLGGDEVALGIPGRADDPEHRAAALAQTVGTFGRIDVLVNNAGINPAYGPLLELDDSAARKILEVNVIGTLAWIREACRAGLTQGGSVINLSSVAGLRSSPGIAFYGVSKAAVIALTEQLAVELGPSVRVNAIAPAVVKTRFAEALYVGREDEVSASYPLKRLGEPEDIAAVAAFLASDDSAWITGQTLVVDGGITITGGV
jgi:NAD(P)-dependent dehydrogenase (short-subunit alcohol dehydrogenase family)